MSNHSCQSKKKDLPAYLTVGLHGIRDSTIMVTLPKYVTPEGYLDCSTLEEDGYSDVVYYESHFENCTIKALQYGELRVDIIPGNDSSRTTKDEVNREMGSKMETP